MFDAKKLDQLLQQLSELLGGSGSEGESSPQSAKKKGHSITIMSVESGKPGKMPVGKKGAGLDKLLGGE